ncbi:MAG: hypothetical protein C0468_05940, partial [Planctomyces sp.]|nr:hypothetical protein [Planctomyces sp.]
MKHASEAVVAILAVAGIAAPAAAQSDPRLFGTVYNIGTVPPGSPFAVPGAATGVQVGDGDSFVTGSLTPTFLAGDVLGSNSQLNLFPGGTIRLGFNAGPLDTTGSNIEANIFGGSVGDQFIAFSGSTVNISGGSLGSVTAVQGGTVNIFGGSVGNNSGAGANGTV